MKYILIASIIIGALAFAAIVYMARHECQR